MSGKRAVWLFFLVALISVFTVELSRASVDLEKINNRQKKDIARILQHSIDPPALQSYFVSNDLWEISNQDARVLVYTLLSLQQGTSQSDTMTVVHDNRDLHVVYFCSLQNTKGMDLCNAAMDGSGRMLSQVDRSFTSGYGSVKFHMIQAAGRKREELLDDLEKEIGRLSPGDTLLFMMTADMRVSPSSGLLYLADGLGGQLFSALSMYDLLELLKRYEENGVRSVRIFDFYLDDILDRMSMMASLIQGTAVYFVGVNRERGREVVPLSEVIARTLMELRQSGSGQRFGAIEFCKAMREASLSGGVGCYNLHEMNNFNLLDGRDQ